MFALIIGLYQPLLHEIARALSGRTDAEIKLVTLALSTAVLSGGMFSMWRMREARLSWMIAANVVLPCATARVLFLLGFERSGLVAAMLLVWLVPAIVVVLGYEVMGLVGRARRRALAH